MIFHQRQPSTLSKTATPAMAKGYKASTGTANHVGNVLLVPAIAPTANVHATMTVACIKKQQKKCRTTLTTSIVLVDSLFP